MAIAVTVVSDLNLGNAKAAIVDIALDATYAAGGYTLTASTFGLSEINYFTGYFRTGENLIPNYNAATGKLEILKGAGTTTVTTGSGAFSELATNDTYASASTIVRAFVIGEIPSRG